MRPQLSREQARRRRCGAVGVAVTLAAAALGTAGAAAPASGRADFELCQSCHGACGQGNRELSAPRIGGLDAGYVERQLADFRGKRRGTDPADAPGTQMADMAATLADEAAVTRVAAYVATLRPAAAAATISGRAAAGRARYATCAACHGAAGEGGATAGAPRLAGMSDWYLLRQLEAFRAGRRGAAGDGSPAAAMRAIALTLPEAALRDVVAYIGTLHGPATEAAVAGDACGS